MDLWEDRDTGIAYCARHTRRAPGGASMDYIPLAWRMADSRHCDLCTEVALSVRPRDITSKLPAAYHFFRNMGNFPAYSRELADAEQYARDNDLTVVWTDDSDADLSSCTDRELDAINKGDLSVEIALLYTADGRCVDSLGGIIGADRKYKRQVAAELVREHMQPTANIWHYGLPMPDKADAI